MSVKMWCEEMLGTDTFLLLWGRGGGGGGATITLALKGIAHTHFLSIPPELVSKFVVKRVQKHGLVLGRSTHQKGKVRHRQTSSCCPR